MQDYDRNLRKIIKRDDLLDPTDSIESKHIKMFDYICDAFPTIFQLIAADKKELLKYRAFGRSSFDLLNKNLKKAYDLEIGTIKLPDNIKKSNTLSELENFIDQKRREYGVERRSNIILEGVPVKQLELLEKFPELKTEFNERTRKEAQKILDEIIVREFHSNPNNEPR